MIHFRLLVASFLISACSSSDYLGIDLKNNTDPALRSLAIRAQSGDRGAQSKLALRFEKGDGVPQSHKRAIQLYCGRVEGNAKTTWIYIPSPGGGASPHVAPISRTIIHSDSNKQENGAIEKVPIPHKRPTLTCKQP